MFCSIVMWGGFTLLCHKENTCLKGTIDATNDGVNLYCDNNSKFKVHLAIPEVPRLIPWTSSAGGLWDTARIV